MAVATPIPYELYSDAPGVLFNKPEWEAANAAHPTDFDFGSVPKGWPTELKGPQVWTGSYLNQNPDLFIRKITLAEIAEVDAAIQSWKQLDLPLSDLHRERFHLPNFGRVLEELAQNIYNGVGVQVLRGFPVQSYSKEDQIIAFIGINSWTGNERLNQGADRGLCHIKSISHIDPHNRGKIYVSAQDTNAQMYHSDAGGDVVSLMAVSLSGTGGASTVASSWQVYNHLAKHRPDILRILAERKFRWQANGIPHEGVNLIHHNGGKLFLNFSTRTFTGYGEIPDRDFRYPALTFEEREAFGGWQWVADQYSLETELQPGDIEWVNNLYLQHARRGFTEDVSQPRHLLRVWLRNSELSPTNLPLDIRRKFDAMFGQHPKFYPLDEIEEDAKRRATGVFTGSCKTEDAKERLAKSR
ncbi:hypothetical protein PFICI_00362 [Pestalotiopsis fici W106-1]|uniref:TauD/TfdA-like domain-containing protein n=1 Tax=Pestalotiopsis fici (strain W106-1 / CGMCC3.15140) TaxID=1229662 RepID=W3XKJ0_PESFW|nr:uncharacterized protein PFICI_00362 [Pestalotiopsis fici W106-1]ETS86534.1 hypothetical protein PFICI_00362 [Pestalotiopsis fici W106-1]